MTSHNSIQIRHRVCVSATSILIINWRLCCLPQSLTLCTRGVDSSQCHEGQLRWMDERPHTCELCLRMAEWTGPTPIVKLVLQTAMPKHNVFQHADSEAMLVCSLAWLCLTLSLPLATIVDRTPSVPLATGIALFTNVRGWSLISLT